MTLCNRFQSCVVRACRPLGGEDALALMRLRLGPPVCWLGWRVMSRLSGGRLAG